YREIDLTLHNRNALLSVPLVYTNDAKIKEEIYTIGWNDRDNFICVGRPVLLYSVTLFTIHVQDVRVSWNMPSYFINFVFKFTLVFTF
ncbi:hypothetical protein L9F63_024823, partial [Diploptera punctata]